MKQITILVLFLISMRAFAEIKLLAVNNITIPASTVSTLITDRMILRGKFPTINLDCSLQYSSVSYNRIITKDSKFTVKNINKLQTINWDAISVQVIKAEVERFFNIKLPDYLNTKESIESFYYKNYGIKLSKNTRYKLSLEIVSEQTNNSYVIECDSHTNSFAAEFALKAINLSNMLIYNPEM